MKTLRTLASAALTVLALVALAFPASAAPGDLKQNIFVDGNTVTLKTTYTPDPKFPTWKSAYVSYKLFYTKAGTDKRVLAREGAMVVLNFNSYKQTNGTYAYVENPFVVLRPGDKIEVEYSGRVVSDDNDKKNDVLYWDTTQSYTHPGKSSQLITPCLDDCLAQLGQELDAGGGQLGGQQPTTVADSGELGATLQAQAS